MYTFPAISLIFTYILTNCCVFLPIDLPVSPFLLPSFLQSTSILFPSLYLHFPSFSYLFSVCTSFHPSFHFPHAPLTTSSLQPRFTPNSFCGNHVASPQRQPPVQVFKWSDPNLEIFFNDPPLAPYHRLFFVNLCTL